MGDETWKVEGTQWRISSFSRLQSADEANAFVERHTDVRYEQFCRDIIADNYSPLFEWCSKGTPVILKYPQDLLVLTGLRHLITGNYMSYDDMVCPIRSHWRHQVSSAKGYNVPVVGIYTRSGTMDTVTEIKENKELEGCVLRYVHWPTSLISTPGSIMVICTRSKQTGTTRSAQKSTDTPKQSTTTKNSYGSKSWRKSTMTWRHTSEIRRSGWTDLLTTWCRI